MCALEEAVARGVGPTELKTALATLEAVYARDYEHCAALGHDRIRYAINSARALLGIPTV